MNRLVLVSLLFAMLGCSPKDAVVSSGSAPSPKAAANEVKLAAAAQKDSGVEVRSAELRSLPQVLRAPARILNDENRTWRVGAIVESRIVSVLANPGDRVMQGQVLARMHSHDIHQSRAEYRKAVAELSRLQSAQALALRVRDRAQRLYDLKAGSLADLEQAEAELRNAQTAVANARAEYERTHQHLVEFLGIPAGAPEHQQGGEHDENEYILVKAPAPGVILSRNVTPGTVVTPANDLFVISDLSHLWAMAEVGEENLSRLRVGMPVQLSVQAYADHSFPGRIAKIGDVLDPATRTVRVRVDVANPRGRLKPEMYATAEIGLGESAPAVFVPSDAAQEVRGATVVFVRTAPDCFEVRPVQAGRSLDGSVQIVSGLRPGEPVAVRGAFALKSEFLRSALAEE